MIGRLECQRPTGRVSRSIPTSSKLDEPDPTQHRRRHACGTGGAGLGRRVRHRSASQGDAGQGARRGESQQGKRPSAKFAQGEGGFKKRDLYPFCGDLDGGCSGQPSLGGKSVEDCEGREGCEGRENREGREDLEDEAGKALVEEMYKVAQEGLVASMSCIRQRRAGGAAQAAAARASSSDLRPGSSRSCCARWSR
jgi:hypothetical protein